VTDKSANYAIIMTHKKIKVFFKTNENNMTERSSEKSFGIVFSIVFLIVALYPLINSENI
jgi:hypothetical protein